MQIEFDLGEKKFSLEPYNTAKEKELLLLSAFVDEEHLLGETLKLLGINTKHLTHEDQVTLLYKLREISVGSEMDVSFVCPECGMPNEVKLDISNNFQLPSKKSKFIKDVHKIVTDSNILEFFKDADDLDWDTFEQLKNNIKDYIINFNFFKPVRCIRCKKETNIDISAPNLVSRCFSEDSIKSILQTYHNLVFFGKFTKTDVDSMYPFERFIFNSMVVKTLEEKAKCQK